MVLGGVEDCGSAALIAGELNWIGFDPPAGEFEAEVQVRYRHGAVPARIRVDGTRAEVRFVEPESAVAPGQGAAFYHGERLLGGGWIESTVPFRP